jgi:hypothetical protein
MHEDVIAANNATGKREIILCFFMGAVGNLEYLSLFLL